MSDFEHNLVFTSAEADWPQMVALFGELGSTMSEGVKLSATGAEPSTRRGTNTLCTDETCDYLVDMKVPQFFIDEGREQEWNDMIATLNIYVDPDITDPETGEATAATPWEWVLQKEGMQTMTPVEPV